MTRPLRFAVAGVLALAFLVRCGGGEEPATEPVTTDTADAAVPDDVPGLPEVGGEDVQPAEVADDVAIDAPEVSPGPDQTPPTVTIDAPQDGDTVAGTTILVSGTVGDPAAPGEMSSGVAGVSVNGAPAKLQAGTFTATLKGLPLGPLSIVATATDNAGHSADATVGVTIEPLLLGLAVEPTALSFTAAGETAHLDAQGLYDGALILPLPLGATWKSADPKVASVDPTGTVTALGDGVTTVTVTVKDVSREVPVAVALDLQPPGRPEVLTYLSTTNLRHQTWLGRTEPYATLHIAGGKSPADVQADADGAFTVTIALLPSQLNDLQVTTTDAAGNAGPAEAFPIRQDDTFQDSGAIHPSSGEWQEGVAGAPLPHPLVVRVTDDKGHPVSGREVRWSVIDGNGSLAGAPVDPQRVTAVTDSQGYAQAAWALGDTPGGANTVLARLPGDTGLPVVFRATALPPGTGPTSIEGFVLDENRIGIAGVPIQLVGTSVFAMSDERGHFVIEYAPNLPEPKAPKDERLSVDGWGVAGEATYARIDFTVPVLSHQRNQVLHPFYIPRIPDGVALDLDASGVVQTGLVIERALGAGVPPTRLHVPAGTKVVWPKGTPEGKKKLALVDIPVNRTPMPLPDGLYSGHTVAVQPGGTTFDPPLPIDFPNLDGLSPGDEVTIMSFDHDQGRYLAVGTATVSADGTRVTSDPGSGIKVGAWHSPPRQRPPDTCEVTGTVDTGTPAPKGKPKEKKKCECKVNGKAAPCPPETDEATGKPKPFTIDNVPCGAGTGNGNGGGGPPPTPDPKKPKDTSANKVEVKCDDEEKPLHITQPAKKLFDTKQGKKVTFVAHCEDGKSDDAIQWAIQGGDPAAGTGASVTSTFLKKGKFTVTASASTKTCKGSDSRTIRVDDCVEAGSVRVCGKDVAALDADKGVFEVSGDVTLGRGAEQFLRVTNKVTVNQTTKKVSGNGTWSMDSFLGPVALPNLKLMSGSFEIDGATGAIPLSLVGEGDLATRIELKLSNFAIKALTKVQLDTDGLSASVPVFDIPLGKEVKVQLNAIAVKTSGIVVSGRFKLEKEVKLNVVTLTKAEVGYNLQTDVFDGSLGFKFGPPLRVTELTASTILKAGTVQEIKVKAEFSQEFGGDVVGKFKSKGLPIPPAMVTSPVVLLSINAGMKNPGFLIGTNPQPFTLFGGLELGLGPTVAFGEPLNAELYLAKCSGDVAWLFRPTTLDLDIKCGFLGRQTLTQGTLVIDQKAIQDLGKGFLKGHFGVEPLEASLEGGMSMGVPIGANIIGVAGDVYNGSVKLSASGEGGDFFAGGNLKGSIKTPSFKLMGATVPQFTIASIGGFLNFRASTGKVNLIFKGTVDLPGLGASDVLVTFLPPAPLDFNVCHDGNCLHSIELSSALFVGDPAAVEVPPGQPAVELSITHGEGDLVFDLLLPDGTVLAHDGPALVEGGQARAFFVQGLVAGQSTWVVTFPEPGVYQLVNVTPAENALEVRLAVPDQQPKLAFLEPFSTDGAVVHVAFAASDADSDASIDVGLDTDRTGFDGQPVAHLALSEGKGGFDLDTSGLAPGTYFVHALVDDGITVPAAAYANQPIVVLGDDGAVAQAPQLVRGAPAGPGGLDVSWLPGEGATAETMYTVTLTPRGSGEVVRRTAPPGANRVIVQDLVHGRTYDLEVRATSPDGVEGLPSLAASGTAGGAAPPEFTTTPRTRIRAGLTYAYAPTIEGGGWPSNSLVLQIGPPGMSLQQESLVWPTTGADVGAHEVAITRPAKLGAAAALQRFTVHVVSEDALEPPEVLSVAPMSAKVGTTYKYSVTASATDDGPVTVTVASGPDGMTVGAGGVVTWKPTAAQAVAGKGAVAFTLHVQDSAGLVAEQTAVIHFDDPDDDGLPTAYERASGLDPFVADDAAADPDQDGLTHAKEALAGTRGDVADSDGDGLTDGAEKQSDPRLKDEDEDGLDDAQEKALGTDTHDFDSDKDGVKDGEEVAQGSDPLGIPLDGDKDGVPDDLEQKNGTDPSKADADGDGCDDGDELTMGTSAFHPDTDGDGAADCDESKAGTDPTVPSGDSDDDGLSDDLEATLGTNPFSRDTDGDGFEDGHEVALDLDPKSGASKPDVAPGSPSAPSTLVGASSPQVFPAFTSVDVGVIVVIRDDDLDGAPNDYELKFSYDPFDAADGPTDDDSDGLKLFQEARAGTDPKKADTDGDGVPDGQELQDGTDPLDPKSFSKGGPVTKLEVLPKKASLTSNTFFGPASLQLVVLGVKDDGTSLDLTKAATGTTYEVDDPAKGSVSEGGLFVAAPGVGEVAITITNLGLTASVTVTFDVFTPKALAQLVLPGVPGPLDVQGGRLVVAVEKTAQLVDVSIPEKPLLGPAIDLGATVKDVALDGTTILAATGSSGLAVVDVSSEGALQLRSRVPLPGAAAGVAFGPGVAYVATDKGLTVVDLSAPPATSLVDADNDGWDDRMMARLQPATSFTAVDRGFGRVAAGSASGGLSMFKEGATGADLTLLKSGSAGATPVAAVLVLGSKIYAALGAGGIAEVSFSATPPAVTATAPGVVAQLARYDEALVGGMQQTQGLVTFFGTSLPGALPVLGTVSYGALFDSTFALGLDVEGAYHYVSAVAGNRLFVGQHDAFSDLLGSPPMVSPLSPSPNATFDEGTSLTFAVKATDDVKVVQVTLSMDGEELAELDSAPFEAEVVLPAVSQPTDVVLGAAAADLGGNVGTMEPLTLHVVPVTDTEPPKVAFITPLDGGFVGGDAALDVAVAVVDDHAVVQVEFLLDGAVVATSKKKPFGATIAIPAKAKGKDGAMTLMARATDLGENVGTASIVLTHAGIDLVQKGIASIGKDDHALDGADVLVAQGSVAIDGAHDFGRLRVGPGGVLGHSPTPGSGAEPALQLTADVVEIAAGGAIDVTGRGYLGDCASGDPSCGGGANTLGNVQGGAGQVSGGSHGGVGAGPKPPATFDDWKAPKELGTGGGYGNGGGEPGGSGGGRVHLVAGELVLEGAILAHGGDGAPTGAKNGSGGGGGALWIEVGTITGAGELRANGGAGGPGGGSVGGGGGRVALSYDSAKGFDLGHVSARGGVGSALGGAPGTVTLAPKGKTATVIVDDASLSAFLDDPVFGPATGAPIDLGADLVVRGTSRVVVQDALNVHDLFLEGDSVLTHPPATASLEPSLTVTANEVTIQPKAGIDTSGRGYLGDCAAGDSACGGGAHGPGNKKGAGAGPLSGGSHGGSGAGPKPGAVYGDALDPQTLGAGGGYGNGATEAGGNGGGRVSLTAAKLVLDGRIRADGGAARLAGAQNGGGGAGGSVKVAVSTLVGFGEVSAAGGDGGPGVNNGAGGGGGRVLVAFDDADGFDLTKVAAPGGGGSGPDGAPGTVTLQPKGALPTLVMDDGGLSGGLDTPAFGPEPTGKPIVIAANLVLRGKTRLVVYDPLVVQDLTLEDESVLAHPPATATYEPDLDVTAETLTVSADAAIDVSGRGYLGDCAPGDSSCGGGPNTVGNVQVGNTQLAGGSHGGLGARGGAAMPSPAYGDPLDPRTLGTGGGYGNGGGEPGGNGGGRVRIQAKTLVLDGAIRADGAPPAATGAKNGGAGAGGSVRLDVGVLAGGGLVTVSGGPGLDGYGGGGGRVAVRYETLIAFDLTHVHAHGGTAGGGGGPGTVVTQQKGGVIKLRLSNEGVAHTLETAPWIEVGVGQVAAVTPSTITVSPPRWRPGTLAGLKVGFAGTGQAFTILDNTGDTLTTDPADGDMSAVAASKTGYFGVRTLTGDLSIEGKARVALADTLAAGALAVTGGGVLTHPGATSASEPGLQLTFSGKVTVASGAAIDVTGRGYLGDCAPGDPSCGGGAHTLGNVQGGAGALSGGSHGGRGAGPKPGSVYGDTADPRALGAGGGLGSGGGEPGGSGGGRLRMICGSLALDGALRADGGDAALVNAKNGGGGAGGSIRVITGALSGKGSVTAAGGAGGTGAGGAGGGGGRVAIAYDSAPGFDLGHVTAFGGGGAAAAGAPGTVALQPTAEAPTIVLDDGGTSLGLDTPAFGETSTGATTALGAHLVVKGTTRLVLNDPLSAASVELQGSAVLTHGAATATAEPDLVLTADAVLIGPDAAIDVTGRGYLGDCRAGVAGCSGGGYTFGNVPSGAKALAGGAHGGLGGQGGSSGLPYGDPLDARTLGGGGGYGSGGGEPGGNGGGRIHITAGLLRVGGAILADGGAPPAVGAKNGGAGAGGSIRLDVGTLAGGGLVSAAGGAANVGSGSGAGGGGGRIAITYQTLDPLDPFDLQQAMAPGGAGAGPSGGPGTVVVSAAGDVPLLRVSNGGLAHASETAPWVELGVGTAATVSASGFAVASPRWLPGTLAGLRVGFEAAAKTYLVVANTATTVTVSAADGDLTAAQGAAFHGVRDLDVALHVTGAARTACLDRVTLASLTLDGDGVLTTPATLPGRASALHVAVTGAVDVAADGLIDVSGRGYLGDCQPGVAGCGGGGYTLGNLQGGAGQLSGGSHGGLGGGPKPGSVFDDAQIPDSPGGGGGYGNGSGEPGGNGGGAIWLKAGAFTLNGAIVADGGPAAPVGAKNGGGGAGGSIRIEVTKLVGAGLLSARGGAGGAGGGGGRLRLIAADAAGFLGAKDAAGGLGATGPLGGQAGTVVGP